MAVEGDRVSRSVEDRCHAVYALLNGLEAEDCRTIIANCSAQLAIEYAANAGVSTKEAAEMIVDGIREVVKRRLS